MAVVTGVHGLHTQRGGLTCGPPKEIYHSPNPRPQCDLIWKQVVVMSLVNMRSH